MPRPIPPPLSLALTHLRTARGWTQNELAAAVGLSGKTISERRIDRRGGLERWAEEMAWLARLAGEKPEAVYAPCWGLRDRLRLALPVDRTRPPLLIPARRLTDRVLRRRAELEDPIGAGHFGLERQCTSASAVQESTSRT